MKQFHIFWAVRNGNKVIKKVESFKSDYQRTLFELKLQDDKNVIAICLDQF